MPVTDVVVQNAVAPEQPKIILAGPKPNHPSVIGKCEGCPYGGGRCGSRGNPAAPIVFIAEAPGAQEIRWKLPLVGPSGKLFWGTFPKSLREWGISPEDDVLILNAVQCLPPRVKNDAAKTTAAISKGATICRPRLLQQLQEHPRKLIVAMGNHATRSTLGLADSKITQIRGQLIPSPLAEIGVIPVLHPAALLRGTGNYRQFKEDLAYAFDLLRGLPPKKPIESRWQILDSEGMIAYAVNNVLLHRKEIACDTETGGFDPLLHELLCLTMCADPEHVYVIPGPLIAKSASLRKLFSREDIRFTWQNGKFDMRFMRRDVGEMCRVDDDTMLMSYALDEQGGIHDLEQIAGDLIGAPDYKHMLKPYLPNKQTSYRVIPKPVLYHYAALDTTNTRQIAQIMLRRIMDDKHTSKAYRRVLIPASEFLYWIEKYGIRVDTKKLDKLHLEYMGNADLVKQGKIPPEELVVGEIPEALAKVQEAVRAMGVNQEINPGSWQQVAYILWDVLKLKSPWGLGNRSTDKFVLERIPQVPFVKALRDYRKAAKAYATYVKGIRNAIRIDGRIHATYKIHGTRTGRLSSAEPNMQNIPRGPRIRGVFWAGPGRVFIKVDLNQAELRSLALLSDDPFLKPLYIEGIRSLHDEAAKDAYPAYDKTKKKTEPHESWLMRAKAVNFGIVYGREAASIAEEFGIPLAEAQHIIDRWFIRSPGAKAFIDECRQAPLNNQTLITPFGRKKRHHVVTVENLHALQNEASNFPHQSIASDICLLGAAKARPILRPFDIHPVNVVHDEAMFECPDHVELISWAKFVIERCMESIPIEWGLTGVPFKAEGDVGEYWAVYRDSKEHPYDYTPPDPSNPLAPPEWLRRFLHESPNYPTPEFARPHQEVLAG